jgi:hypothetical protein
MNDFEAQLRAAIQDGADEIEPASIAPFRVPASGLVHRILHGGPGSRSARSQRWLGRLAPLAAATAVVALAAGSIALASSAGHGRTPAAPGSAAAQALPAYSVGLTAASDGTAIPGAMTVRSVRTGRVTATVRPPAGQDFTAVSGAQDNGSVFILSTASTAAVHRVIRDHSATGLAATAFPGRLYVLRLSPPGTVAQLAPLHLPVFSAMSGFALSPDGTSVAVVQSTRSIVSITLDPLGSGSPRTWTLSTHQGGQYRYLGVWIPSWTDGDDLLWAVGPATNHGTGLSGLPNTAIAGGDLATSSFQFPSPRPCAGGFLVSPDGKLLITSVPSQGGGTSLPWKLVECRIDNGQVTVSNPGEVLRYDHQVATLNGVYWSSDNGQELIGSVSYGMGSHGLYPMDFGAGVIRGDRITPLPGSAGVPYLNPFYQESVAW